MRLAWVLLLLSSAAHAAQVTPLPKLSTWKYDTGTDRGIAWRAPGYADTAWAQGPGVLGFGDPFIATPIPMGPNATTRYPTAYFRTTFNVSDPASAIATFTLSANYDDGFILYLNGSEIVRRGLSGTVTYGTLAANHQGGAYETIDITPQKALLLPGVNVLAAEVHQQSLSSSDLAWDAELTYQTGSAAVTRGPYLAMGTTDAMTIRWRTNVPTDSRVWLGPAPDALVPTFSDATSVTEHELRATGLAPGTRFYYAVGTSADILSGADTLTWFDTAPESAGTTRVWVLGDSGLPGVAQDRVRDAYYAFPGSQATNVWLMLGDNAYTSGTDSDFQSGLFTPYASFLRTHALWPTRGNHDVLYAGANNDYYELFTMPDAAQAGGVPSLSEAWYSFDHGNIHFVCLDSEGSDRAPGAAQLTWLEADLAATDRKWIVAFWHHPPYTHGSHNSDDPTDSGGRMRDMRKNAMPILEAGGVDLVLNGHSHSYERSFLIDAHYDSSATFVPSMKKDAGDGRTIPYEKPVARTAHAGEVVAVAGSSAQISGGTLDYPAMAYSLNLLGSLVLDVSADTLRARFLDDLGVVRDDFAIVKSTALVAAPRSTPRFGIALAGPNPARGRAQFVLEGVSPGATLRIVDAAGRRVRTLPVTGSRATWDAGGAAPGVYFAVLEHAGARRVARVVLVP